jgi:hypothetical protein
MLLINTASAQDDLKANEVKATKTGTKTFNIVSLDGKNRMIKIIPDYANHVLKISCLNNTISISDYWGVPPEIHLLNSSFIEINYAVRAGSNVGLGNTLIVCVNDNKLYEAMHTLRLSNSDHDDLKTNYIIKLALNGDSKNNYKLHVQVHDYVYSKQNPQENYNYSNQTFLSFDTKHNVFYNIKEDIYDSFVMTSTGKKVKQKIEGNFPVIMLGKETYYYINDRWYQIGKSNEINEFH